MKMQFIAMLGLTVCFSQAQVSPPVDSPATTAEENAILAQVLEIECPSGTTVEVARHTCWPYMSFIVDPSDTERINKFKEHVRQSLHLESSEIGGLIDQLFEKNPGPFRIGLSDPPAGKYAFEKDPDPDGEPPKDPDGATSDLPWILSEPAAPDDGISIGISRPAIDPAAGRVLVYVVRSAGGNVMGDVVLYGNKDGKWTQIGRGTVVMS